MGSPQTTFVSGVMNKSTSKGTTRSPTRAFQRVLVLLMLITTAPLFAGPVPADRLLSDDELVTLLNPGEVAGDNVRSLYASDRDKGLEALAAYLRDTFSQRYYFDWKNVKSRFADYEKQFPGRRATHAQNRDIHLGLYPARARWKLPYENLKGDSVSAYELRHLARQHKVLDIAFMHHYENADAYYVDYFTEQMRSLNEAFTANEYEDDEGGNGVYESFRAGYRVMNWFQVHAFFLGSEHYGRRDQLELVRTMLHTGAVLHAKNRSFRYGNHQTRGAVALAMIAILLNDYAGTGDWYRDAMTILGEHLDKEVNPDGFQFERSIHYHIGDIYNFFRVLQLAQLNDYPVPEDWRVKLKGMFDAAVVLARPDRHLPVFQDDTDMPWAEYNEMGDFMLLGSVLFDDPVINYFASDRVASAVYWLLREEQIVAIAGLDRNEPIIGSAELPDTGYYVMREGWNQGDYYLAISAGLSEHKPDHQHGDMLGIVARANGQEILPNYQVRYSLPDFEYFKNSLVKNVAIVDGVLHGRGWKSNKGGSGFGKWEILPEPELIAWSKNDGWDFFAGSHDGYADLGVDYYRKVLFIRGLGWVVRDIFESSNGPHAFQQVWQGHYSDEDSGNHHRAVFADGSGLEILQLGDQADSWSSALRRGKGNLVYTVNGEAADYTTLLYPFASFSARIPEALFDEGRTSLQGWTIRVRDGEDMAVSRLLTDARLIIEKDSDVFLLGATRISRDKNTLKAGGSNDFHLDVQSEQRFKLTLLGHTPGNVTTSIDGNETSARLKPGSSVLLPF